MSLMALEAKSILSKLVANSNPCRLVIPSASKFKSVSCAILACVNGLSPNACCTAACNAGSGIHSETGVASETDLIAT